jgi:hypothetical protein
MEKGWIGCGATIDTTIEIKSGRKQNFMQGIKDKIVVITGASSESIRPPRSPRRPGRAGGAGSGIGEAT